MTNWFYIGICFIINFLEASAGNPSCKTFNTEGSRENQTIISLDFNENQGNESIDIDNTQITYEWNVYANIIEGKCDSLLHCVPCYLRAWKSALMLKNQLRVGGLIQGGNGERQISISNSMIESGFLYLIELKIIHIPKAPETKCFSISNTNNGFIDNQPHTNANNLEVILIGPDRTFCTLPLIINAYVVGNYANATFKWAHKEAPGVPLQTIEYQGPRLELPGNTLKASRNYEFFCNVIDDGNNVLTMASLKISVRKPKPTIRLQNRNQSVGVNQPIRIVAHVDVSQDINYEIIWTCTFNGDNCGRFSTSNILYVTKGFPEIGLYKFELFVSQWNKNDTAYIEVKEFERSIEFDALPTWINPTKPLDISFILKNIQSACTVEWHSLHNISSNYKELNISKTNFNKIETVFVDDDPFLKELVPYNRKPSTQTYTLKINPELMQLEQDSKYILRCSTICITDTNHRQTIYADLEFVTNAPPKINNLDVWPRSGSALSTTFHFETMPAKDKSWDLPLTYSFGWYPIKEDNDKRDDQTIVYFASVQELYMAETILPCVKDTNGSLGTIMTVCDNKGSCSIIEGPIIKIFESTTMSEANYSKLKHKIIDDLALNNFGQFTIDVLMILWSFQNINNIGLLGDMQIIVNGLLEDKVKSLMDRSSKVLIHELISSITGLEDRKEIAFKPSKNMLKHLSKLRSKLVHDKMRERIVTDSNQQDNDLRSSVNNEQDRITIEDIQKYFESTELIMLTSDDPNVVAQEESLFIKNLARYLNEVCYILYNNPERHNFKFSMRTFYIVLEKFSNNYFRSFMYIPNSNNKWNAYMKILLNQSWHMQITGKLMCIGKAVFRNYLKHPGLLFYARLFNSDRTEFIMNEQPNTIMSTIGTLHDVKCSVYSNGTWYQCRKGSKISVNSMCMCDKMGFFRFDNSVEDELELVGESGESDANGFAEKDDSSQTAAGKTTQAPIYTSGETIELNGSSSVNLDGQTSGKPESKDSNTEGPMVVIPVLGTSSTNTVGITSEIPTIITTITGTTLENGETITESQRVTIIAIGTDNSESTLSTNLAATSTEIPLTTGSVSPSFLIPKQSPITTTLTTSGSTHGNSPTNISETSAERPTSSTVIGTIVITTDSAGTVVESKEAMTENPIATTHTVGNPADGSANIGDTSTENSMIPASVSTSVISISSSITVAPPTMGTTEQNINAGEIPINKTISVNFSTATPYTNSTLNGNERPSAIHERPMVTSLAATISGSNSSAHIGETSFEIPVTISLTTDTTTGNISTLESMEPASKGPIRRTSSPILTTNMVDTTTIGMLSSNGNSNSTNSNARGTSIGSNSAVTEHSVGSEPSNGITTSTTVASPSNITTFFSEVDVTASAVPPTNSNSRNTNVDDTLIGTKLIPNRNSRVTENSGDPGRTIITTPISVIPEIIITIPSTVSTTTAFPKTNSNNNSKNPSNSNTSHDPNGTNTDTTSTTTSSTITPTNRTTILATPTPTTAIVSAFFMSVGDQISFVIIGLCIIGASGLILFGIFSKRVRKVQKKDEVVEPGFPLYADIFEKENMHR